MQVTVGSKFQIVIPKEVRTRIRGLRPGAKVAVNVVDDKTIALRPADRNWTEESRGLMKDAWKNIDAITELGKMRDEWK